MAKPTDDITWASDANYPAGSDPWDGQPTTAEPVSGRKATGWEPKKKPGAQALNWWQRGVWRWISWFSALFTDPGHLIELDTYFDSNGNLIAENTLTRHLAPKVLWGSNFLVDDQLTAGDGHANFAVVSTANGAWVHDLEVPGGYRLTQVIIKATGASGVGLTLSVVAPPTATGSEKTAHSTTGPAAGPTDVTMNTYAKLAAGTSIVVSNTGGMALTRIVGSWLTEGFEINQRATTSGFVNGANNTTDTITAVTATVLTFGTVTPVAETKVGPSVETVSTANDSTQYVALLVNSVGSNGAGVRAIRCTYSRVV